MNRRCRLRLAAAASFTVAAALSVVFAHEARATDRDGFTLGWAWTGGCTVTYVNNAPSYGRAVHDGLWALEASTGIDFIPVPAGPADVTITEYPHLSLPGFDESWVVIGYYDYMGHVALQKGAVSGARLQRQVITHEVAHFLGLAHIDEAGSLMNVNDSTSKDGLSFGDVSRLQVIGSLNGCLQ